MCSSCFKNVAFFAPRFEEIRRSILGKMLMIKEIIAIHIQTVFFSLDCMMPFILLLLLKSLTILLLPLLILILGFVNKQI